MEVVLRGNFGWDRKNTKVPCLTKCLAFIAILMSRGTTANKIPISCHLGVLNCWCSVPEVWSLTFINKQGQKNVILSFCISSRPPPCFTLYNYFNCLHFIFCNPAIHRENRFCFHCKNIVEDDFFLLDCPLDINISEKSIQNYLILIS